MATEDNFTFPHSSFGQQGGTKISKMMSDNALTMLPAEFEPDENDVICQRGKDSFKHEGNKHFRELIDTHISPYLAAGSRQEKSAIVGKIYDHIRKNASKPSNGFVRKDLLTRRWFLVSDKEARDKVGQALRDAIKVIRSSSRKSTPDRLVGSAAEDKNELLSSSATPQQAKRRKRSMSQQAAENPRIQYDHEQTAEKDLPGGRESSRWGISSMDFRVDGSGSAPHLMSSRFFENQSQAAIGPFPLGSSSGLTGAGGRLLDDVDGLAMASSGTMLESSIEPIDGGKAGQKRQISSGFDSSISSNNNALQFASEGLHYPYHDMMDGSTIMKKSPPMRAVNAPSPSFSHQQEYFEGRAPPAMRYQQENPASELQLRMRNALGAGSTTSFLPSVGGGGSSAGTSMYFAQQQQQQQQQQSGGGQQQQHHHHQGIAGQWDFEPTPLLNSRDSATTSSSEQRASALAHLLWPDDRYTS